MSKPRFAILEVRAGTGGDEAKIWASDLIRMYTKFASSQGWKTAYLGDGRLKVVGADAYQKLKFEGGVHRVQRVPETERHGRIHTSTATVAVIPEIPKRELQLDSSDLEWQFFRASTQGGQNVQKVNTAVRLIHKPSGVTVESQRERKQAQNRELALKKLQKKLQEKQSSKRQNKINQHREVIGQARRSEKIRTYNYSQNRVTDHRINKKWQNLENIVDGDLKKVVKALQSRLGSRK